MKLGKHWTLLSLMILFSLSSLAQYPAVKKIGKDSVVIITLEQGNQINKKFATLDDSIKGLHKMKDSLRADFDREFRKATKYKSEADTFQYWYTENKKMYLEREAWHTKDRRHYMGFSFVLMFMVVLFAAL
jgi:hypothetical protein